MQSFEIHDLKLFSSQLFLHDTFDDFQLCEADFVTFSSFHIDGRLQKDYFDTAEQELIGDAAFARWKEIRPFCLSLIRGKRLPLQFRIILRLPADHPLCSGYPELCEEAKSQNLFLNILYKEKRLVCTTGASSSTFRPGVIPGRGWDSAAQHLFRSVSADV